MITLYNLRMTSGLNKVNASMDAIINETTTIDSVLLFQVGIKTGFNAIQNWFPAIIILL